VSYLRAGDSKGVPYPDTQCTGIKHLLFIYSVFTQTYLSFLFNRFIGPLVNHTITTYWSTLYILTGTT